MDYRSNQVRKRDNMLLHTIDNFFQSHPKDYKCSISPRSLKAETIIRAVDEDFPVVESDAEAIKRIMKAL